MDYKPRQEKITIGEVEYTFQSLPARYVISTLTPMLKKDDRTQYIDTILENVVVNPKLKIEDFNDDIETLMELINSAEEFLFRKKQ